MGGQTAPNVLDRAPAGEAPAEATQRSKRASPPVSTVASAGTSWRRRRELADSRRVSSHYRREIQRRQRLWLRTHLPFVIGVILLGAAIGGGFSLAGRIPGVPSSVVPYLHGALAASVGWAIYVLMSQTAGIASSQVGVLAEEWTADRLRPLRREGWHIVHDVAMEFNNLDHALIGPKGVFAIETKFRSDWSRVDVDQLDKMARQAARGARDLSFRIGLFGKGVTPIVAVWTSRCDDRVDTAFEHRGVRFIPGERLKEALNSPEDVAAQSEIDARLTALDDYVRNRNIGLEAERGPEPRTVGTIYTDVLVATLVVNAAFFAMVWTAQIRPTGLWSVVVACITVAASAFMRRRFPLVTRIRLCTTAAMATALGLVAAGLAVVGVSKY